MARKKVALKRTKAGLAIPGRFVPERQDPYKQLSWGLKRSSIKNAKGELLFTMDQVEAPVDWSQLAVDIAVSKYFRRSGVPRKFSKTGGETSIRQMIARVVETITASGLKQKYFAQADAKKFAGELAHLLLLQKAAFNSPVWFNLGLFHKYGIKGSAGGLWYWDTRLKRAVESKNSYEHSQCSACFILDIKDDLMSIFEHAKTEARIFKFGSGTGSNFSQLRAKGEWLDSGGESSGVLAFLEVLDRGAGATKSGGTTRRAAKMVCLDADHPEVLAFINWKVNEEKKARVLIEAGFDASIDGEAYHTVSGQNSNNSVRFPDEFFAALKNNGEWVTRRRTDGQIVERLSAKELWRTLATAAWTCADPGVQFSSTINHWHTCLQSGEIRASNPCSEFMFLDNTACNLASINLVRFLDEDNQFDIDGYLHACRILFIAQEILVDQSAYPTAEVAQQSHIFRPLGLGYANLGGLLMRLGIAYDSDEGRRWAAILTALMTGQAYLTSVEMSRLKGSFKGYKKNQNAMLRVIKMHQAALTKIENSKDQQVDGLLNRAHEIWNNVVTDGKKYGFRNSQATVLAPTGTIGLLMDCDTTGIEPDFSLVKFKKMAGGGYVKIVNQAVESALKKLNYNVREMTDILNYLSKEATVEGAPHLRANDLPVFDCANRSGSKGTRFIAPMAHVKMMAAVQPFISGAISKTVNLPNEASVAEVENIYLSAWQMGLKAIATYRDGSKLTQPLNSKDELDEFLVASHIDSPLCSVCGHKTVRSGTCFKCLNCGHSDSC